MCDTRGELGMIVPDHTSLWEKSFLVLRDSWLFICSILLCALGVDNMVWGRGGVHIWLVEFVPEEVVENDD